MISLKRCLGRCQSRDKARQLPDSPTQSSRRLLPAVLVGLRSSRWMPSRAWAEPPGRRADRAIETDLPPITVDFRDVAEEAGLTAPSRLGRRGPEEVHPRDHGQRRGHVRLRRRRPDGRVPRQRHDARRRRCRRARRRAISIAISAACGSRTSRARAGLARVGWAQGVCAGDYDNDGAARSLRRPTTVRACCTATRATARSAT